MMLQNYRSRQFLGTSNGINPSSGLRNMGSTKSGLIWCLAFNQYLPFSFHGNLTIFSNWIFDLDNSRSRSYPRLKLWQQLKPSIQSDHFFSWGQRQIWWPYLRPNIHSICLFFISWQLAYLFLRYINWIFDLENSRPKSWPRSKSIATFEASYSIDMVAFHFVAIGPFLTGT